MRIDIVTIFPEFFDVLDLSLLGKARQSGLIELGVHNLRDHTHDRHHSVDDTPYGGGAGMVMKPEPWGDALDAILGTDPAPVDDGPIVIFPRRRGINSPSGWPVSSRSSNTSCSDAVATRASTSVSSITTRSAAGYGL
jgi:tRNA G37 N-methylase TrmD